VVCTVACEACFSQCQMVFMTVLTPQPLDCATLPAVLLLFVCACSSSSTNKKGLWRRLKATATAPVSALVRETTHYLVALVLAARCADCMPHAWPHDTHLRPSQTHTACHVGLLRVLGLLVHITVAPGRRSCRHTNTEPS
jgi:hypothetical protein